MERRFLLSATSISGAVFNDLNGNGEPDPGESGLGGWSVYVDEDGNGQFDVGEPLTETRVRDGYYEFPGLSAGEYQVDVLMKSAWKQTGPQRIIGEFTETPARLFFGQTDWFEPHLSTIPMGTDSAPRWMC